MQMQFGLGSGATLSIGEPSKLSVTTSITRVGAYRKSTLNHTHIRWTARSPLRHARIVMLFARSCAFGTTIVDQSRVSTSV